MSPLLRPSASPDEGGRIRGHHRGLEIEWSQTRFAELIRRPVETALALGLSAEEAWAQARSTYRVAAAFERRARTVFDAVFREQQRRSAAAGGNERR
jgi:hypothetical protein